jgi:hypothetical protein
VLTPSSCWRCFIRCPAESLYKGSVVDGHVPCFIKGVSGGEVGRYATVTATPWPSPSGGTGTFSLGRGPNRGASVVLADACGALEEIARSHETMKRRPASPGGADEGWQTSRLFGILPALWGPPSKASQPISIAHAQATHTLIAPLRPTRALSEPVSPSVLCVESHTALLKAALDDSHTLRASPLLCQIRTFWRACRLWSCPLQPGARTRRRRWS